MKRVAWTMAVLVLAMGAGLVIAQQSRDGSTTPTAGISFWPIGGTDGTNNRAIRTDTGGYLAARMYAYDGTSRRGLVSDPSGILRVTEEYPEAYQSEAIVICADSSKVTSTMQMMGNAVAAYPFAYKAFEVTTYRSATEGADTQGNIYFFLAGSENNTGPFAPLMRTDNLNLLRAKANWLIPGTADSALIAAADTTKLGPIGWLSYKTDVGIGTLVASNREIKNLYMWTVPDEVYPARYLAVFACRDSTPVTALPKVAITFHGRMK